MAMKKWQWPRSIIRLMVNILDPQPGETVYDPACGTGGMLLETVHHVKEQGGDPRLLTLKGQEKNLHNLSIPLYVDNGAPQNDQDDLDIAATIEEWQIGRVELKKQTKKLFATFKECGFEV